MDRIIRARNVGDTTFRARYDNQWWEIPPNQDRMIPYPALVGWFGDPEARDHGNNYNRRDEVHRIKTRYGAWNDARLWELNKPHIECYDMQTQDRVFTIVDDPDGERMLPASTSINDQKLIEQQMAEMQQQMQNLRAELERRQMVANMPDDSTVDSTPGKDGIIPDTVASPYSEIVPGVRNAIPAVDVQQPSNMESDVDVDDPMKMPIGPSRTGPRG